MSIEGRSFLVQTEEGGVYSADEVLSILETSQALFSLMDGVDNELAEQVRDALPDRAQVAFVDWFNAVLGATYPPSSGYQAIDLGYGGQREAALPEPRSPGSTSPRGRLTDA